MFGSLVSGGHISTQACLLSRCSLHPSTPDPKVLSFLRTRVESDSLLWIALLLRGSDLGQDVTSVLQPLLCTTTRLSPGVLGRQHG